jgi:hypothetical protein
MRGVALEPVEPCRTGEGYPHRTRLIVAGRMLDSAEKFGLEKEARLGGGRL